MKLKDFVVKAIAKDHVLNGSQTNLDALSDLNRGVSSIEHSKLRWTEDQCDDDDLFGMIQGHPKPKNQAL